MTRKSDSAETPPLPMLEKRRIEAAILKNVYDVLVERHGKDEAEKVIGDAVIQSAVDQGRECREQHEGESDLLDFAALGERWEMGGALKREILVKTADKYEDNMVHCAYTEMYKEMGLGHIGHLLSCNRDTTFCRGFNPAMELTVTQTIMGGADYCDFRYRLKKDSDQD